MAQGRKLLIVDVAALGSGCEWRGPDFRPLRSVLPAVTCTVQASFRTAARPGQHGMIGNGLFHRDLRKVLFWEQSAGLVQGERIWSRFRAAGGRVAMLFWQQSLGEAVDLVLSPAPIHRHHGGMIDTCYSVPEALYPRLCAAVGRPFKLRHYWGPLASTAAGDWIAEATAALLADRELCPDLCLTYLPTLDYALQRHGPGNAPQARRARAALGAQLDRLLEAAATHGFDMLVFGDYHIAAVDRPLFPNRHLHDLGLLATRAVRGMHYLDPHASRAFAVVDHEVAHIHVRAAADLATVREACGSLPGVAQVLDADGKRAAGLDHANSGELVLLAETGCWFAYPWWNHPGEAPDYAGHVDIHNKPGFDPCELFFGWPPPAISQNPWRVRGSHGLAGADRATAWAATGDVNTRPETLCDLATAVKERLDRLA